MANKTTHAQAVRMVQRLRDLELIPEHLFDSLMEHGENREYHPTKRSAKTGNRVVLKDTLLRRLRGMTGLFNIKDGVFTAKKASEIRALGVYKWLPEPIKAEDGYRKITNSIGTRMRQINSTGTKSDIREAKYIYEKIRDASSMDDLRIIRNDLGWDAEKYTAERAESLGIRVNKNKYASSEDYRNKINENIKREVNRIYKARQREELGEAGGYTGYSRILKMSPEAYAKQMARNGQRHLLKYNEELLPEGMGVTEYTAQWYNELPDVEKQKWVDLATPILEYNKSVISKGLNKSTGILESAPNPSELLQWHHLMPREFGGENTPENISAALGDAFSKMGESTEHSILHGASIEGDVGPFRKGPIEDFYKFMQSRGATKLNYPPAIEGMPASPLSGRWPIKPRGNTPGVPAYHPLPEELRGGGSPTMGWSNAPADAIPRSLIKVDLGRLSQQRAMNEAKYLETYGKDQADYEERRKRGLLGRAPWRGFPGLTFVGGGGKK